MDDQYVVHGYMRSHMGGMMSMRKGELYYTPHKQMLNTKRSNETELVAADYVMSKILLGRYFMESQGYHVGAYKLYQDNMSPLRD